MLDSRIFLAAFACLVPACTKQKSQAQVSCTAFNGRDSAHVLSGKSFDWADGSGLLMVNPRGEEKRGVVSKVNAHEWISRFGSLSFVSDAKGHSLGGINEAGLVIEVLYLSSSQFPAPLPSAKGVNELQWVQFVLDSFSTVEEVKESLTNVYIEKAFANIHYFACDKSAKCITVDPVEGKYEIADLNPDAPQVLTNDTRANAEKRIQSFEGFGGDRKIPEPGTIPASAPTARYARMSSILKSAPVSSLDAAFSALNAVRNTNPSLPTQWQIVYDQTAGGMWFKHLVVRGAIAAPAHIELSKVDFSCREFSSFVKLEEMQMGNTPLFSDFKDGDASALIARSQATSPEFDEFKSKVSQSPVRNTCRH